MASKKSKGNAGPSSGRDKGKKRMVEEPYDKERFANANAQRWFDTDTTAAIPERGFNLASFGLRNNEMETMFFQRDWRNVVAVPPDACLELVREFYANAYYSDGDYNCVVRGRMVNWSVATLNELLGTPNVRDQTWTDDNIIRTDEMLVKLSNPGAGWYDRAAAYGLLQKDMNINTKAIHKFICSNLSPTGHVSDACYNRVVLNFCIQSPNIRVNFGLHVYNAICKVVVSRDDPQRALLACPHTITRLLSRFGVDVPAHMRKLKPAPIIKMSRTFGLIRRAPLAPPVDDEAEDEGDEGQAGERQQPGTFTEDLCDRLDGLEESNSSMLHQMGELRISQDALSHRVGEMSTRQDFMIQRQVGINWMLERFAGHLNMDISDRPPWPQYPPQYPPPPPYDGTS